MRLLLLQTALCAAVAAAVLLTSKLSPAVYERMRGDYSGIMAKNMTVGQVWEQIKNAASFAIKPVEERGEQPKRRLRGRRRRPMPLLQALMSTRG